MHPSLVICVTLVVISGASAQNPPVPRKHRWFSEEKWPFEKVTGDGQTGRSQGASVSATGESIPMDILQQVAATPDSSNFIDKFLTPADKGVIDTLTGKNVPGSVIHGRKGITVGRPLGGPTGSLAQHALCKPSPQVIELAKDDDPFVLYFPTCTRINRCGGCCRSNLLECQASEIKKVNLQIIKTKYTKVRSNPFNFDSLKNVTVDEHIKCRCQCRVKASDCNSLQVYKPNECKCECNNQNDARTCKGPDKFWDSKVCACKCKNYQDQCSTSYRFSERLCRCIPEEAYRIEEGGETEFLFGRTAIRRPLEQS